jgi:hypothetical protein
MRFLRFIGGAAAILLLVGSILVEFYPTYTEDEARPLLAYYAGKIACAQYHGKADTALIAAQSYNNVVRHTRQEGEKLYLDPDEQLPKFLVMDDRGGQLCVACHNPPL